VRRKESGLCPVGEALSSALKRQRLDRRTKQEVAAANWSEVVGEKAAAASTPEGIRDGILFVACKSPTWAQELTLLKDQIIRELNKKVGSKALTDIRFSGSGLPKADQAPAGEEQTRPSPKEIQNITLDAAELSRVEKATKGVRDEHLAAKIRGALRSQLQLERWRLEHGSRKRPP